MPTPRLILTLFVFSAVVLRDPGQLRVTAVRDEATPARASWVSRLKSNLGRVCDAQRLRPVAVAVRPTSKQCVRTASPPPPPEELRVSFLESRLPPPTL